MFCTDCMPTWRLANLVRAVVVSQSTDPPLTLVSDDGIRAYLEAQAPGYFGVDEASDVEVQLFRALVESVASVNARATCMQTPV